MVYMNKFHIKEATWITISKYMIFNAVVELGSLTKAAEVLHLTQSGVSHAMSSLEHEFGFSLLTRDRAGITLTSNGERMLTYIRDTLQCNERIKQEVAAINGLEVGSVRVGTFTTVSSQWLPGMIKQFQDEHPAIDIILVEGDYEDIERWIANGTVDFGFLSLTASQSFEVIPLVNDKMVCILHRQHPLRRQSKIRFEQMNGEPFIMPKWGKNDIIRRMLYENNVKPKIKYEVIEDQAIVAMVENGLGISILPEMLLFHNTHNVCIVNLEIPAYRRIGIALQSIKNMSPAARTFLKCIQSWLHQQGLLNDELVTRI